MGVMDELLPLLIVLIVFFVVALPFMVFDLRKRMGELEERVRKAEEELKRGKDGGPAQVAEPAPDIFEQGVLARAKEKAREERQEVRPVEAHPGAVPPPLPNPAVGQEAVSGGVQSWEQRGGEAGQAAVSPPSPPPVVAGPNPLMEWLEKVGLKPPLPGEEGAHLIAWWSTRAGLVLGVIAAVFFGLYVNQNTVPLVRLVELLAVAGGLFAGGFWMEKKLGAFGRALSAGGLALFYVAAYAAYGLPAMKVIEAPLVGAIAQVVAVGLMAGWALWRRNEGVFGLALALGYVTSWFSYQEGVEPLPLISLLVLAAGGAALFALRGWWSGILGGLAGSSLGLMLLAVFRWSQEGGPTDVVGLGAACLLTVLLVAGVYVRWLKGESMIKYLLPLVTSSGVLVGAVVTWALEIDWEWYYASFAVLLLVVGWLWRKGEEALWEVMWAKASVFVALFLIAKFDGPVRAYGLLAQAGSLAFLARRKGWLVFDVGALLAVLTGWFYVQRELTDGSVPIWGTGELVVLGFLFGALGLVAFFARGEKHPEIREKVAAEVVALLAMGVCWVAMLRVDHEWALLAGLIGAAIFIGVGRVAKLWQTDLLGVVFLLPGLMLVANQGASLHGSRLEVEVEGVGMQLLIWLGATWGYCAWLGLTRTIPRQVVSTGMMLVSIGGVVLLGSEYLGHQWSMVVLLGLAVLWRVAHLRVPISDLKFLSVLPALLGGFLMLLHWDGEIENGVLIGAVIAVLLYWGYDVLFRGAEEKGVATQWFDVVRAVVMGLVLFTAINLTLEGAFEVMGHAVLGAVMVGLWWRLRDVPLAWVGLVGSGLALKVMVEDHVPDAWHEVSVAVLFVLFVVNGLVMARSGREEQLAQPKAASVIWGILAMVSVLVGLVLEGEATGSTTAFWAVGAVALLAAGFWGGLRGYRVIGLVGIGCAILRLFAVDLDETFWRIVAFGVTGALLVGIGYVYNRFHQRLADNDLDWRKG